MTSATTDHQLHRSQAELLYRMIGVLHVGCKANQATLQDKPDAEDDLSWCRMAEETMAQVLHWLNGGLTNLDFSVSEIRQHLDEQADLSRSLAGKAAGVDRDALLALASELQQAMFDPRSVVEPVDDRTKLIGKRLEGLRESYNDPGWPRPYADHQGTQRPVPFIVGGYARDGQWARMRTDRLESCYRQRLCAVCGSEIQGPVLFGVLSETVPGTRRTSGPGCCNRCMLLTIRFCPHFQERIQLYEDSAPMAWAHHGSGHGLLDDEQLSKNEPRVSGETQPLTLEQIRQLLRSPAPEGSKF